MSRKHYVAVAQVVHRASQTMYMDGKRTAFEIADSLAEVFAADNPQFDRERFLEAVRTGRGL